MPVNHLLIPKFVCHAYCIWYSARWLPFLLVFRQLFLIHFIHIMSADIHNPITKNIKH